VGDSGVAGQFFVGAVTRLSSSDGCGDICPLRSGFLVTCAAGAPFTLKLVQAARGDLALSGTLVVLLLIVTMVYMPFVVPAVLPEADVRAGAIAAPLVTTMLLPLALGLFIAARNEGWAHSLEPVANKISTVALVVLIAITIVLHFGSILTVLSFATVLLSVVIIGGAFGIGFLFGGPDLAARSVLGLGTAQRNIAAATVVATQGFEAPGVIIMVVLFSLLTFAILFPMAALLRRISGRNVLLN